MHQEQELIPSRTFLPQMRCNGASSISRACRCSARLHLSFFSAFSHTQKSVAGILTYRFFDSFRLCPTCLPCTSRLFARSFCGTADAMVNGNVDVAVVSERIMPGRGGKGEREGGGGKGGGGEDGLIAMLIKCTLLCNFVCVAASQ